MATLRTRTFGWSVALGAAVLALRPIGPFERLVDLALAPARLVGDIGAPSLGVHRVRRAAGGGDADVLAAESALSQRLERAILRSADPPESVGWPRPNVVPVPGEVDVRIGRNRDRITVRVTDPDRIVPGQPVVNGDVYVGSVERIPFDHFRDDPGSFETFLRRLRLSSPPVPPPDDLVVVRLVTDPRARVGAGVSDGQGGWLSRMVVGGLARLDPIWLALHNPESRQVSEGRVVVHEPHGVVESFDEMAEGFIIGDLVHGMLRSERDAIERDVLGVEPKVDFESGLNQVLVLTRYDPKRPGGARVNDVVPVLEASGWEPARITSIGDTSPWRSTARLDRGRDAGVRDGAALVDGHRLVGRVSRVDQIGASVALVDDPGFRVRVLAQAVAEPDARPLVLGELESAGRDDQDRVVFEWRATSESHVIDWASARGAAPGEAVDVRLWTGSGMLRVPRGLLLGRTALVAPDPVEEGATEEPSADRVRPPVRLALTETGDPVAPLLVRTGSARLSPAQREVPRPAFGPEPGAVQAAERSR